MFNLATKKLKIAFVVIQIFLKAYILHSDLSSFYTI